MKIELGKVIKTIITIVLLIILVFAYNFYQSNNFNGFIRSEKNLGLTEFKRDNNEKYSKSRTYKIKSEEYNDAMFFKTVDVEKNQPYRITCMVKTENVEAKDLVSGVGAQISIEGTTQRSMAISGTSDWKKIELIVNSKDRGKLNIGFRLGGYLGEAKGKAWFSDFTIEEGIAEATHNIWNFGCFIFSTTDVNIEDENINVEMSENQISDVKNTLDRFKDSTAYLSKYKMEVKYDIHMIDTPLSSLSYSEKFGYYVAPEDVEGQIDNIIKQNNYDHIFVIIKLR